MKNVKKKAGMILLMSFAMSTGSVAFASPSNSGHVEDQKNDEAIVVDKEILENSPEERMINDRGPDSDPMIDETSDTSELLDSTPPADKKDLPEG